MTHVTDNHEQKQGVIPNIAIGEHLTEEQRSAVLKMLADESNAFSSDDNDDGDIKSLQPELKLSDPTPVQKPYISIPRPLYQEVKQYIEDLIDRGWITESKSSYSSGCVIVRKKGTVRLCVDYRHLNNRTMKDRHPIPKIQETLDNLARNTYFSILDQNKGYYQGYVHANRRYLTAFIYPWGLYE